MSRKYDILTNLREYSSDQIAEAINDGVVTMYELSKSGNLTPLMRKRIEEKLATGSSATSNEETKRSQDDRQLSDVAALLANYESLPLQYVLMHVQRILQIYVLEFEVHHF